VGIEQTAEWDALAQHAETIRRTTLKDLFATDPGRAQRLTFEVGTLAVDLSKQRVTAETIELLLALAARAGVAGRRDAMLRGERINSTEGRAVLHTALRSPAGVSILVDGHDVVPDVHAVLDQMGTFAERIRSGAWVGATGARIHNVINIGIGGSDLGPAMAYHALKQWSDRAISCRYVSNVDASDLVEATVDLDPAETLFIISSKTFTTLETMTNAHSARDWITAALGEDAVPAHMVAVSTNLDAVAAFGIDPANAFGFWDWVGGRYSMDSAIGLSLMVAIGREGFDQMLQGFRSMDEHFATTPEPANVPLLMGLCGLWERDFLGSPSLAVVPYAHELALFPAYLQQLDMESNGKHVTLDGQQVAVDTGPIVWGTPGTNGQHAYFQLLHQGTTTVPLDLIGFCQPVHELGDHHDILIANLLAQSEALAFGRAAPAGQPYRDFPGNRPTTVILGEALSPHALGELIALYEHKVFVQGAVWDINSFDQFGVELGKVLALDIIGELRPDGSPTNAHDSSTNALINRYRASLGR
jgi:glucose-6-phosphate isomerase